MSDGLSAQVRDNKEARRYELHVDGGLVLADYRLNGNRLAITHTETPPALQGRGLAGQLVRGIVEDARARGLKIVPLCSYIAAWFQRHPEESDLLAEKGTA